MLDQSINHPHFWFGSLMNFSSSYPLPSHTLEPVKFTSHGPESFKDIALMQEVEKMLSKEALEIVMVFSIFLQLLFPLIEATGGWRPVIDLSPLNVFAIWMRPCMKTTLSILAVMRKETSCFHST